MDDIQQRAHDFACAAVQCYQIAENGIAYKGDIFPKYDLAKLSQVYSEAFSAMYSKLNATDQNQGS